MTDSTILWRRLDLPGHESARVFSQNSRRHLAGTSVFTHDRQPCRLDYSITCDSTWHTLSARVAGWVGNKVIEIEISVDSAHRWLLNGKECAEVAGCTDLDLNFSPSTNLLPVRRLKLEVGQEAGVRAAWLRFPGFNLEPLEQTYRRIDETTYRYASAGGRFITQLQVNPVGFVTDYPNFFQEEIF